jgi:hypothetical protein
MLKLGYRPETVNYSGFHCFKWDSNYYSGGFQLFELEVGLIMSFSSPFSSDELAILRTIFKPSSLMRTDTPNDALLPVRDEISRKYARSF